MEELHLKINTQKMKRLGKFGLLKHSISSPVLIPPKQTLTDTEILNEVALKFEIYFNGEFILHPNKYTHYGNYLLLRSCSMFC